MKTRTRIRARKFSAILITGALLIGCVGFSAGAEDTPSLSPDEQYIVMMDAIDWLEYEDHGYNVLRAQIPDNLLNQMTTDQLVNAVLRYPYMIDIVAFDTYSEAFQIIAENFNGLAELLEREDGAQKLSERLRDTPVPSNRTRATDGGLAERMQDRYLDILMAQPEFLNQLSDSELEETIAVVDNKIEQRLEQTEIYSEGDAYQFYKVVNEQVEMYQRFDYINTPSGKYSVRVRIWEPGDVEKTIQQQQDMKDSFMSVYSGLVYKSNATWKYNCHSYAWYSQNYVTNSFWITDASAFVSSGSGYTQTYAQQGAKIYYSTNGNGVHSGVVLSGETIVSKWGEACLFQHNYKNCPASYYNPYVTGVTYWK